MSANRIFPKGIMDTLLADGTVNGFISGRIYRNLAPAGVVFPYIVVALSSGVSTNDSPGNPKDYTYLVKCVSPSQTVSAQVASAVESALHHAPIDLDSPWELLQIQHMNDFEFVETVERAKVFHSGGFYRIRANQ